MNSTTLLYNPRQITLFHSLWPVLASPYEKRFRFTEDLDWVLSKDKNKRIVLVAAFLNLIRQKGEPFVVDSMRKIRAKYEYVALWDDGAGTGIDYSMTLPFVDTYFKKHLLKDRTRYTQPVFGTKYHGTTVFGDYYYKNFMEPDPKVQPIIHVTDPADLKKLKPIWNLGWGSYPLFGKLRLAAFTALSRKVHPKLSTLAHASPLKLRPQKRAGEAFCSFRYSRGKYGPTIKFQRDYMTDILQKAGYTGFEHVDRLACYAELEQSASSFSPFGWGEVCFRDFESILYDSVLIKPLCDHFETFPDIYRPNETYLPVKWDGSDVVEVVQRSLQDAPLRARLVENAREVYLGSFRAISQRVGEWAQEVLG